MQWHQLDHVQTICTLFQTDNHQHLMTQFLQARYFCWCPANSLKALKASIKNISKWHKDISKRKLGILFAGSVWHRGNADNKNGSEFHVTLCSKNQWQSLCTLILRLAKTAQLNKLKTCLVVIIILKQFWHRTMKGVPEKKQLWSP